MQNSAIPSTPHKNAHHMKSATDVVRELNKIYFEARRGKLPTQDCTRLANVLNIIIGALRETELEADIRSLRESMEAQGIPIKSARPQLVKTAA